MYYNVTLRSVPVTVVATEMLRITYILHILCLYPYLSSMQGACAILYRVIHKSLRNFRTRLRNNQERQDRKEHINK